jgi:DNA modification methylase
MQQLSYDEFLETKQKTHIFSGFDIDESELNQMLFDFQKFTVKRALKAGKYAIFANTGLGKTPMQLDIAYQVVKRFNVMALILAPLAVTGQTIEIGEKFGIKVNRYGDSFEPGIYITNYDQLDNIDCDLFECILLDESSILKNETGKYRNLLIDKFKKTPYKFCFSATPSPNDPMELGNHSDFLDAMGYNEMLAMFFVHDTNETQQWRLKGHAIDKFYEFVSTWAIMYSHPKDIGFNMDGFDLPKLEIIERQVSTPIPNGVLFSGLAVNATDYNQSLRDTEILRIKETLLIISNIPKNEPIIIWTKQNEEAKNIYNQLINLGYDCRNVQGSDSNEKKEKDLLGFAHNEYQIMITKQSIASQGLNYQNCAYQIFNSVDFSFEQSYQAMRRSWRFGQKRKVTCYMITTDRMINVIKIQKDKHKSFVTMQHHMCKAVNKNLNNQLTTKMDKSQDIKTDNYWLMHGDCVKRIKEVYDNSVDLIVFSPPFADLYTYSNHIEDMGNVADYDQFVQQFKYLAIELKRVIKPGRIIAIHCMDLPTLKSRDGFIGIRRFSAMIGDIFEELDMFLHSEFTIWKDPLLAAVRTKTIGLAHKQVTKDMSIIRCGLPDKVLCFKTKEENQTPIQLDDKQFTHYIPMHQYDNFPKTAEGFNEFWGYNPESSYDRITQYSHQVWQRYASPVWMDIDQTNTLQFMNAKGQNDEKHICPLQLGVIERIILLYSNRGETVLSPFGGIGSEGYQSIKMGRKSISIELKESYFEINKRNHNAACEAKGQLQLFD